MILSFDVDCGEIIPGHHFVARGLGGPFRISTVGRCSGDENVENALSMREWEEAGGYPGFTLEYELVPGVPASAAGRDFFRFLVGVEYEANAELPWYPNDGGALAPFAGGPATHGARGGWPLPPDATILTFSLTGVGPDGFPDGDPAGKLVVDLKRGTATWCLA